MNEEANKIFAYCGSLNKEKIYQTANRMGMSDLSKGFYDDLLYNQKFIKTSQKKLEQIKGNAIKESVYSNKKVPSDWQINLNYRQEIFDLIQKDRPFAMYISGQKNEIKPFGIEGNVKPPPKLPMILPSTERTEKETERDSRKNLRRTNTRFDSKRTSGVFQTSKVFTQTEIEGILDDMNDKYDIRKFYNTLSNEKIKSSSIDADKRNQTDSSWVGNSAKENNKYLSTFNTINTTSQQSRIETAPNTKTNTKINFRDTKFQSLSKFDIKNNNENIKEIKEISPIKNIETKSDYFKTESNIYKKEGFINKEMRAKIKILKDSIYNNLLSKADLDAIRNQTEFDKLGLRSPEKKVKKEKFIIADAYEEATKEIKITNNNLRKRLERIDYYGPRYTHCKVCHHKNLEWYQNNETNQALNVVKFIRRTDIAKRNRKYASKNRFSDLMKTNEGIFSLKK